MKTSSFYLYSGPGRISIARAAPRRIWAKGYRTFRLVKTMANINTENEILCPAHELAGRRTACIHCGLCGGSKVEAKNIANIVHGYGSHYFMAKAMGIV